MNLVFHTVRWKNLLSTGNSWTEIQLDRTPNTLIIGENGAGKSTVLDAICYALFNKPYRRINKPQLVNSVNNKGMVIEMEFTYGSKRCRVVRGQKPGVFEIRIDGVLIDQTAKAKDYQSILEKNILKMNYKSFTQIVILGSSTFIPFMQLSAAGRRDVIEDILDIRIFSQMNALLKDKVYNNKIDLRDTNSLISLIQEKIKLHKKHIDSLVKNADDQIHENNVEIKSIYESIDEDGIESDRLFEETAILQTVVDRKEQLEKLSGEMAHVDMKIDNQIKNAKKAAKFFKDHEVCPTCTQEIDEEFRNAEIEKKDNLIAKNEAGLVILQRKYEKLQGRLEAIYKAVTEFNKLNKRSTEILSSIKNSHEWIRRLELHNAQLKDSKGDLKKENSELQSLEKKLKHKEKLKEGLIYDREMFDIAGELLKDTGIKTQIIKQYVPIINKLVNKYLQAMNFFVNFTLDEAFNETIKSRHRDIFSYDSFSEGEKTRIDLALLLTWRAIAKIKNSTNTNLLMLDEVFDSSLDADGGDDFMKLIYDLGANNNVFVISHTQALVDKFYATIKFEKQKNFSRMVE